MSERAQVYCLFALLTLGSALGNLSMTGLNAMLPIVMEDFGVEVSLGQWLTTGYMLMLGVAIPVSTWLEQRVSNRTYTLIAYFLFLFGSLLDWIATDFVFMLFGRVLQAVAVGLFVPLMQDTAMRGFPPGQQATAMGVAGIALGFAPNIGPTIGGTLDSAFGWRSFFLLLFALSIILFVLALILIPKKAPLEPDARFKTTSFVLSTLGVGGILLGLSLASSYGFASMWVWAPIVVGCIFGILFVRRQRRVPEPLIDMHIFESNHFTWGLIASVFLFACYMGVTLVIPLYVQDVLGWTSFDAGLIMFPATFTALVVNPVAGWLADRTSIRLVGIIFGTCLAVGSLACVFIDESTTFIYLTVFQTLRSIGVSGTIGPLATYCLANLQGPLIPHGSSASIIIRQIAGTFGTSFMVCCITLGQAFVLSGTAGSAFPYQAAFAFSGLMGILCLATIVLKVKKEQ